MSDKKDTTKDFFEGKLAVDNIENSHFASGSETDFIETYRKLISKKNREKIPEFNLLEKIKETQSRKRSIRVKKLFSYAASLVAIIGFLSLFFFFNQKEKQPNTQMAEAKRETIETLLYFSKEFNSVLKNFEEIKSVPQPFSDFNKYKIEFNNPMENLKINKL